MKKFTTLVAGAVSALAIAWVGIALSQTSQPGINTVPQPNAVWLQAGIESRLKTFKVSILGTAPTAGGAGDYLTIAGSASKTIRISKIVVGGQNSAAQTYRGVNILRRSAVDTGGTPATPTIVARDINNGTPAATVTTFFAAVPTGGTLTGTLDSCRILLAQTATTFNVPDVCSFTYGVNDDQMTVLRGATDVVAVNFNASANGVVAPATTDFLDIDLEWAEEP